MGNPWEPPTRRPSTGESNRTRRCTPRPTPPRRSSRRRRRRPAYEHRYLRAVIAHHPAPSATGALAWNGGAGRLLDEFAAGQLRSLQLEKLIRFDGRIVTLTARGDRRLAFWDRLAAQQQPAPSGQLALL